VLFDKLDRPLLADFGIALASSNFARVTREGSTIGSSGYMSPEQARGLPIDGRADLYSLGVVTYEMLSGDLPYHGPDTLSVALAHVEQPIPRLPLRRRRWQAFIDKAMAKSPDERFQTAGQMEAALDRIAAQIGDTPDVAYQTKLLPAVAETGAKRSSSGLAVAVVVALAGALMVGYALNRMRRDVPDAAAAANSSHGETSTTASSPATPAETAGAPAPAVAPVVDAPAHAETTSMQDSGPAPATTPSVAAAAPAEPEKPREPPKPRLADLAAGTIVRDRGGPDLAVVFAKPAQNGSADSMQPFALGRYEVTLREYSAFVAATGRAAAKCREPHSPLSTFRKLSWREPGFAQDDSHPVVCVSWDDANAYVQWLAAKLHARYRLPTRAEWSYANRSTSTKVPLCQQGNLADSARRDAGACNDGFAFTAPVGKFKPNGIGIYDLIGNVSEWTSDCKGGGGNGCSERMFSGVSWRDDADDVGRQDDAGTDTGYTTIGIRVVRELADDSLPPVVK
jgi:formylglycine-generating enzyme required for sulfatase activity